MAPNQTNHWRETWRSIPPEEHSDLVQLKLLFRKFSKSNDAETLYTAIGIWDYVLSNFWRAPTVEWFHKQSKNIIKMAAIIKTTDFSDEDYLAYYLLGQPSGKINP